tara:strand:- start:1826 stop:2017 length:192 start_codon:yes stop_codon:yes gene_type:complete
VTVTIDVVVEAGAMTGEAAVALVVTIVEEEGEVVVAQEMEAEVGAMMIVVHNDERLSLLKVLS